MQDSANKFLLAICAEGLQPFRKADSKRRAITIDTDKYLILNNNLNSTGLADQNNGRRRRFGCQLFLQFVKSGLHGCYKERRSGGA